MANLSDLFPLTTLLLLLLTLAPPGSQGISVQVINKFLKHGADLIRGIQARGPETGSDPFCYCTNMMFGSCDVFITHDTDLLHCQVFHRFCCKREALVQLLAPERVALAAHAPLHPAEVVEVAADDIVTMIIGEINETPFHHDAPEVPHIIESPVPLITTPQAEAARGSCGCHNTFWFWNRCPVQFSDKSGDHKTFRCRPAIESFCCSETILSNVILPAVTIHAANTRVDEVYELDP